MKNSIEVKGLSKVYKINHQQQSNYGSAKFTFKSAIKKPLRFITGKRSQKEAFWALKDLDFTVAKGEVVGIIGRNGSGKSTLLKILSRIVEPTQGQAILHGNVASLLEVGTGFHPELTGRENIFFNGAILGMRQKEIRQKFNDIVEFSGIEKFLDTPVKFYSSGMYVRLAFAVAAHLDPDILIVDEVLAVGDAQFQKKSLGRMEDIAKAGRTVLFVSHNMGAVRELCTSGILMEKGQGQYFDDVNDAINTYQVRTTEATGEDVEIKVGETALTFNGFTIGALPLSQQPDIFSGDPIELSTQYLDDKANDYDLCVGYAIRSKRDGGLLVYTHSHLEEVRHKTGKHGRLDVSLNVPKLAPEMYSLELNVWLDGEHLVYEEPIGEFRVVATPTFASSATPTSFPSTLMVESEWKFSL